MSTPIHSGGVGEIVRYICVESIYRIDRMER